MRHLQLFFEIGEYSQPPQQDLGMALSSIVDGKTIVMVNINIVEMPHRSLNLPNTLVGRKHGHLVGVARHQHNHPLKQSTAAGNDV